MEFSHASSIQAAMSAGNELHAYRLFIDDERTPPDDTWVVCRSTQQALDCVKARGMPVFISFDHDLGGDDTAMVFLRQLVDTVWDEKSSPPAYAVHSANPVGAANIRSFMESWKKIL